MQFVEILRQPSGVVLGDRKDDGLARANFLVGRQLLVVLPGQPVELLHHLAVGVLVGPFALELGWVVVLIVHVCTLSE